MGNSCQYVFMNNLLFNYMQKMESTESVYVNYVFLVWSREILIHHRKDKVLFIVLKLHDIIETVLKSYRNENVYHRE